MATNPQFNVAVDLVGASNFAIGTSPTGQIIVNPSGQVGIGQKSGSEIPAFPSTGLDVRPPSATSSFASMMLGRYPTSSADCQLQLNSGNTGTLNIYKSSGSGNISFGAEGTVPSTDGGVVLTSSFNSARLFLYQAYGANAHNQANGAAIWVFGESASVSSFRGVGIGIPETTPPNARLEVSITPSCTPIANGIMVSGVQSVNGYNASVIGTTLTGTGVIGLLVNLSIVPTSTTSSQSVSIAPMDYGSASHTHTGLAVNVSGITNTSATKYAASFTGGNVGIGTTVPGATFHSLGTTVVGGLSNSQMPVTMGNSQINFWINEASNTLSFQAKYSTGVVKSGTVSLT